MSSIGIVGAGIGGLHLGILLRKRGVPATVYTANSGDELASGRLLNTVMHHHHTLAREQEWGVLHWNPDDFGWSHRYQHMGTDIVTGYSVPAAGPSVAVDYRLYLQL
ncbi:hypothetical protein [Rhodococcus sp. NPDC060176]|uniref:hypothetical protein n=1 Tax=Rhodococcus sp. NPDC060176 TaxID=3347062 RepID=UPI00364C1462